MDKLEKLSHEDVGLYRERGYITPLRVLSADEAASFRANLESFEQEHPDLQPLLRHKTHLALAWADELIRQPAVLDAVEAILGPNILCWGSGFFIKGAHDPSFVSWHQDATYWGLEPPEIVTAWIALSDSVAENGAMRVIPGSHTLDQIAHRDTFAAHNLLSRGQEIAVNVDESRAVALELQPGEMSLHHVRLIHGSEPNRSSRRRIGFAIRYVPTYVRQTAGTFDSATLVRGEDGEGHFLPERRPSADLEPEALAFHERITRQANALLMREASPM